MFSTEVVPFISKDMYTKRVIYSHFYSTRKRRKFAIILCQLFSYAVNSFVLFSQFFLIVISQFSLALNLYIYFCQLSKKNKETTPLPISIFKMPTLWSFSKYTYMNGTLFSLTRECRKVFEFGMHIVAMKNSTITHV